MDIDFVCGFIIQYQVIYFAAQIVPALAMGELLQLALVPPPPPFFFFFFKYFLIFWQ